MPSVGLQELPPLRISTASKPQSTNSLQHRHHECNTLVHIVSILNVTRYATQVNRHSINNLIDAICTTSQDINNLYNLTTSLAASINFNQIILHIRSVFANLCRFSSLPLDSFYTYHGIHQHHHLQYTVTTYLYQWWICRRCYNTLLTPCCQPCTSQYHQMTPYISTDTCIYTS